MHSLTALLAITGDWGRPQRRDFRNWPAGQRMEIEHLSIQMPCFASLFEKIDVTFEATRIGDLFVSVTVKKLYEVKLNDHNLQKLRVLILI